MNHQSNKCVKSNRLENKIQISSGVRTLPYHEEQKGLHIVMDLLLTCMYKLACFPLLISSYVCVCNIYISRPYIIYFLSFYSLGKVNAIAILFHKSFQNNWWCINVNKKKRKLFMIILKNLDGYLKQQSCLMEANKKWE